MGRRVDNMAHLTLNAIVTLTSATTASQLMIAVPVADATAAPQPVQRKSRREPQVRVSRCTQLGLAPQVGSPSICVISDGVERYHSRSKKIDAGTSIHCPLQHLQAVDLTFCLSVAPGFGYRIVNRRQIVAQRMDEAANAIMG